MPQKHSQSERELKTKINAIVRRRMMDSDIIKLNRQSLNYYLKIPKVENISWSLML